MDRLGTLAAKEELRVGEVGWGKAGEIVLRNIYIYVLTTYKAFISKIYIRQWFVYLIMSPGFREETNRSQK